MGHSIRNTVLPRIYGRSEHIVSRKNIDPDALKIIHRLSRNGYKAYLVGGGVRDLLLDKKPKDFDIATDARPFRVKALFRNCRIIGRRFKLAHVYFAGGKIIEVSTFRDSNHAAEEDENGVHPDEPIRSDNVYGTEETDALRRDITINALFYDLSNFSIIDYVGGMQDLQDRRVRVIGDPQSRFIEDPVRLLRVVRYAAKADFSIDPQCKKAILKNHDLILKSSSMRLYEELRKDLCSGYCSKTLPLLYKYQLLQHLLPELSHQDMLAPQSPYVACLKHADTVVANHPETAMTPMLCLLGLFMLHSDPSTLDFTQHFSEQDEVYEFSNEIFKKLAVPRKERERICGTLTLWLKILTTPTEKLKPSTLIRNENYQVLLTLLELINRSGRQQTLLDFLTALPKRRDSGRGQSKSRRKRSSNTRRGAGWRSPMPRRRA
ncbi:MAG: polynucleotide adenylyltransferase PcnB [Deltaproteobacteria bacterium]|nr:polynucleotide adenylyltransferase PcnB [Deltaproteobacteria bacterium]